MKISDNELELLTKIDSTRAGRKKGAWLTLGLAMALIVATERFGWLSSMAEAGIPAILLGAAAAHLAYVYFAVRPEDKLMDLLQRYVNQDPDAVQQLGQLRQ